MYLYLYLSSLSSVSFEQFITCVKAIVGCQLHWNRSTSNPLDVPGKQLKNLINETSGLNRLIKFWKSSGFESIGQNRRIIVADEKLKNLIPIFPVSASNWHLESLSLMDRHFTTARSTYYVLWCRQVTVLVLEIAYFLIFFQDLFRPYTRFSGKLQ